MTGTPRLRPLRRSMWYPDGMRKISPVSFRQWKSQGCGLLLIGLILICTAPQGDAGGQQMAKATNYEWKDLWLGHGPAWSPTGSPAGLTIVHSKAAWERFIKAFGPPYDSQSTLS